jgi:polysaccharide biosynthesis protein PslH
MDILVISSWFPFPPSNGSKLRAYHLIKGLSALHRVHLLTFAEPGEDSRRARAELGSFCQWLDVVPGNPAKAPQRLTLSGLVSDTPRAYRQGFSPAMKALVERRASACQAAVALQLPASLYLRGLQIPRLVEEVEVTSITQQWAEATGLTKFRRGLTVRKLAHFVRLLSQEMDHLTVVSEAERSAVIQMGCNPARVSVVPNGADPVDLERPPAAVAATTAVYSGSPTYGPNLDAVRWFSTEVWPIVRAQSPGARFLVTGSTKGVDLGLLPSIPGVEFTGFVDDVKSLIAASGACVVPLRLGGGTRLKVLEAMALGTPVVATTKAVEGIDVVDDSHVLIADTAEHFAAQVLRLFADRGLAERLRHQGRVLIRDRYAWPEIAAGLSARLVEMAS